MPLKNKEMSSQPMVTRQHGWIYFILGGLAGIFLVIISGLLVRVLAPQVFSTIDAFIAETFIPPTPLYVTPDGTSLTCDSWENACGLQTALQLAVEGDEIWVKAGIYRPAADTRSPDATFQLKNGVAIYGGFDGKENRRRQRDWETNLTVLSGDLGGDDTTDANGVVTNTGNITGTNVYHIVTGSGVNNTALLDGFVITAGYASLTSPNVHAFGGGMFNWAGSPTLNNLIFSGNKAGGGAMFNIYSSNPTLTNVTFIVNTAGGGAGMYNDNSSPSLTDVTFSGNNAIDASCMVNGSSSNPVLNNVTFNGNTSNNKGCMVNNVNSNPILQNVTFSNNSAKYGAGMYNYQSSPSLTDVIFSNNRAGHVGGAMENEDHSSPTLTKVLFSDNSAIHEGGGMFNTGSSDPILTNVAFLHNSAKDAGGGAINNNVNSNPTLTNVTFAGNHAIVGGGMSNWQSNPILTNVTFSENKASMYGGAMYSQESTITITNSIIWDNLPLNAQYLNDRGVSTITFSIVAGGFDGEGNLDINPWFVDLVDTGDYSSIYPLLAGSPAIDAGDPNFCPETDQRGMLRPADGDQDGSNICDIGAYEFGTLE